MGSILSRDNSVVVLPHLPDELIRSEILTRLPVKSVIRFRCVCKSWNSMLSGDSGFIKSHLTNYSMNLNNAQLIFRCSMVTGGWELGGSVNGLVCIYHYNANLLITCVGIWNPATNHYKDIPLPPIMTPINPGETNNSLSIGFDPVANDYKLVYLAIYPNFPFIAQVYSCNAGCWSRKTVRTSFVSRGLHLPWPTIVRGRPFWSNKDVECRDHYYVMFFDVQDEIFRLLPDIPDIDFFKRRKQHRVMVNLRDSLAFMLYEHATTRFVDVYIFDERFDRWTKNYMVEPITVPKSMSLLRCFRNGDLLFNFGNDLKLVSVNPETYALNKLGSDYVYNSSRWNLLCSYGFDYIESLVTVEGMNILDQNVGNHILIIEKRL